MAFKATYIQRGDILDYVPQANVAAGDVAFIGPVAGIAKLDIKAGELGALAITGVYRFAKATGTAIDAGDAVYYDSDNGKAVKSANAYYLGVAVKDAASAATEVDVVINQGVSAYEASGSGSN